MKAVLFDLDGTLLQLDTVEFTAEYLKEVSRAVVSVVDPGRFVKALLSSTDAMKANRDPSMINAGAFWADFRPRLGVPGKDCLMVGNDVEEDLAAARVGMKTYLVTDYIMNNTREEFNPDWFGSLEDLAGWLAAAPL